MTSRLLCRLLQHMAELTLLLNCMLAIALASDEPKLSGDVEPPKAATSVPVVPTPFYRDLTSVLADRGVQVAPSPSSAWRVERDIRLNAPLDKLTVDSALPRQLVVAAIFRPERANGTLFAVRGPGGRIKFGLSYSVSASSPSEPPRLEMRLWSEATASAAGSAQRPAAVLTDVKPGFRLGVSIISFYVYLDGDWLSYEFWCPGEPFWSINPEYGQRVPSLDSGTQHQIQFPAGSTLHLLSDGVDNFFRGDIARLLLASPVPEHSQRRWLKCQSGLGDVSPIIPATRGLPSPRPPPPEFSALSSSGDTSPQTDWLPKEMTTTLDAIDGRTTTVASILPVAVRTSLKGEKGERGLPGLPGVCTEKCPGAVGQDSRLELQPPATAQPGAKGEPGPPGPKGAAGPAGSKGDAGRVGEKGDVGPEGPRGNAGPAGPMGEVGPPGSFGERGPIGPKGDIGLPGSKGERGLTGTAGPPGARGEPGPKGLPGSTGEPGSPGAPGPPGPPGESMRVESTDSPATVRGEKGEKGDKGDKGDRGDRGDRGDPGMRGQVGPPGREGPSGSVGPVGPPAAKGSKGEPGRSCDCTETRNAEPQRPQPPALVMTPEFPATSGVRVISSHEIFSQIGHTLPEGALVYAKDRSALFLKTDFDSNAWIEILTGGRSSGMAFPTSTTPATTPTLKPEIFMPNAITGPRLRLVALPFKLYGDLKYKRAFSNLAADYACQDAARSAGLSSFGDSARKVHFRAFLNGLYSTVETLVRANQRNSVPIVNLHSQKLFENYSDMLNRGVWNSEVQLQDFAGRNLSQWTENLGVSEILAWRGLRHRDLGMPDCEGFFSRSVLQTGLATDLKSGRLLQSDRKMACDSPLIVLCIEAQTWLN